MQTKKMQHSETTYLKGVNLGMCESVGYFGWYVLLIYPRAFSNEIYRLVYDVLPILHFYLIFFSLLFRVFFFSL